jgi:uncharacterized SAM-binding protein YcdF (DUF218 family)
MYRLLLNALDPFLICYLLAALALVNLWRRPAESRRRLWLLTIPFIGLTLVCLPVVAYLAMGTLEWCYAPLNTRPADVQAIVVLSSEMRGPDGVRLEAELGEESIYRCLHAVRLYRAGPPCPVLLSGGKCDTSIPGPTLAELMHDFLRKLGVAEGDLIVEDRSRTTYENAVESAKLLRERGIERIVVVSDAMDLLRADLCFRKQGFEPVLAGTNHRAARWRWRVFNFLPSASAAKGVERATHEWLGIAWYWMRGRL